MLFYFLEDALWFNIGSTDTFERNLENAQIELNMGPENYIPVVYKNEVEGLSLLSYLPQIIMWGEQLICNYYLLLIL